MEQNDRDRMFELIHLLNRYRYEYYDLHAPTVSDEQYDKLYCELVGLQSELTIYMANSPSVYPGYPPVESLEKANTLMPVPIPASAMEITQLMRFQMQKQLLLMPQYRGVLVQLIYEDCQLKEMATCLEGGRGYVVTHNVCSISGVPLVLNRKERLVVLGTVNMDQKIFDVLKQKLVNKNGVHYSDVKEMTSDAVHLLDPMLCRKCQLQFCATEVLAGYEQIPTKSGRLSKLLQFGFSVSKYLVTNRPLSLLQMLEGIARVQKECTRCGIPLDGVCLLYNDIVFSRKCVTTGLPGTDRVVFDLKQQKNRCFGAA